MKTTVQEGYRACTQVTRRRAANFYYGIRLLPADKRRAMCAVYAYARRIDDIGDGHVIVTDRRRALAALRGGLDMPDFVARDPVLIALEDARRRYGLPVDALHDLVDGVEMDVTGTDYERFDDLVVYCRRVAGSVGRLCLAIFGTSDETRAVPLSDDLGVALQLTNILRDVREDLELGRTYLPAEDLRRFDCEELARADPADLAELVRFEAARAREWMERGRELLDLLDRRSAACAAAMSGIYERILRHIEKRPADVLHTRVSLPAGEKAWVAARSVRLARPRRRHGGPVEGAAAR